MDKPTIFLSHSTKDKDLLLKLKAKLDSATGGVLEMFLSSDGQSIPFGQNWVHRIEQGLDNAKIMFVFVTSNSISSNWIYFEAGFAYSKNIEVIPVGIGVDIALLNPPLSLLQGFNIISGESLNNFLAVINDKFDYNFSENFTEDEFTEIMNTSNLDSLKIDLSEIFEYITYKKLAEYGDGKGGKIKKDLDKIFNNILDFLQKQNIEFSYSKNYGYTSKKVILVSGIRILLKKDEIVWRISPYNFENSLNIFNRMLEFCDEECYVFLKFWTNNEYKYMNNLEHVSSILSKHPESFKYAEKGIGSYIYNDLRFSIHDENQKSSRKDPLYYLGIPYKPSEVTKEMTETIFSLINNLVDEKIICKL